MWKSKQVRFNRVVPAGLMVLGMIWPLLAEGESGRSAPEYGDLEHGSRLYRVHCSVCHGYTGDGQGPGARVLSPPPANHRDGSLMNARDNRMIFDVIGNGCAHQQCTGAMPAFGQSLSELDRWDLVAHLRQLHLPLTSFFPNVRQYLVKQYQLGKIGNEEFRVGQIERLRDLIGQFKQADLSRTVFTLFKAAALTAGPELVPQEPRLLARLKKENKLGYVFFMNLSGAGKHPIPVGLALDNNFTISGLLSAEGEPAMASEINHRLARYVGMGKRGDRPEFKTAKDKKDKIAAEFDKAVIRMYALAVEAANAYEFEERERSWADNTF
jgi:mono/diheme cytochrome c family protein